MGSKRRLGNRARRGLAVLLAACFAGVVGADPRQPGAFAQQAPPAAAPSAAAAPANDENLDQATLESLLAPIALFPDNLLMQVLMASTYPLEVVQAQRWLGQGSNRELQGDALATALNAQPWDPSVKSLVPFPDLLKQMSDQLEWTQRLGDALLSQQEDVLNAVQVLRGRAQAAGMLQSGPQQTVEVTQNVNVAPAAGTVVVAPPPQIITIAPAQPERVYVPVYDPNVVFGTWPHAAVQPVWFPPPPAWGVGNAILTGMAFAGGVAIVNSLWGWSSPGWGRGDVNVNVNRFNNINVNRNQITSNNWRHNTANRHGVAYSNDRVRNSVRGAEPPRRADSREQFRGRADQIQREGGIDRAQIGDRDRPGGGTRPGAGERPGVDRQALADRRDGAGAGAARDRVAQRPSGGTAARQPGHAASGRPNVTQQAAQRVDRGALQGAGQAPRDRAAAQRGQASRQTAAQARPAVQQRASQATPQQRQAVQQRASQATPQQRQAAQQRAAGARDARGGGGRGR